MSENTEPVHPPKILIVDDMPSNLQMLSEIFKGRGFDIRAAMSGKLALQSTQNDPPDLILLDIAMPDISGYEVCKKVNADDALKDIPIIFLTARDQEQDKVAGLEGGADDYITKPFSPRELIARIKAVLRRRTPQLTDDVVETGGLRLDPVSHRLHAGEAGISLGPTEFRLLHFFMTHPERVYSRTQLLDEVWGDHVYVEERTVDVHIRRLRSALEASGHDRLIETVRGSGYCLRRSKN